MNIVKQTNAKSVVASIDNMKAAAVVSMDKNATSRVHYTDLVGTKGSKGSKGLRYSPVNLDCKKSNNNENSYNIWNGVMWSDSLTPQPSFVSTPSMLMLNEAAAVLNDSSSSLVPMEVQSTGGVYQLRRQKSFYEDWSAGPSLAGFSPLSTSGIPQKTPGKHSRGKSSIGLTDKSNRLNRKEMDSTHWPTRSNSSGNELISPVLSRVRSLGNFNQQSARSDIFNDALLFQNPLHPYGDVSRVKDPYLPVIPAHSNTHFTVQSAIPALRSYSYELPQNHKSPAYGSIFGPKGPKQKEIINRENLMKKVAVFKPEDEETGAKKYADVKFSIGQPNPERAGMVIGGGARRECAAYMLDKNIGRFSGVPETALVCSKLPVSTVPSQVGEETPREIIESSSDKGTTELPEKLGFQFKRGSLQRFCESDGNAEDCPDLVNLASNKSVHAIGILDLRIFNTDRHGGNILCKSSSSQSGKLKVDNVVQLIPIDHALSLPNWYYLSEAFFDWQFWPQASAPFDIETLEIIEKIDADNDATVLRALKIPEGCIVTNKICTIALKVGARSGLNLKDLGAIFQRSYTVGHKLHNQYFSPLEHMIMEACTEIGILYYPLGSNPPEERNSDLFTNGNTSTDTSNSNELNDNVDVSIKEELAFDNSPPPTELFENLQRILELRCRDGTWRNYLRKVELK